MRIFELGIQASKGMRILMDVGEGRRVREER